MKTLAAMLLLLAANVSFAADETLAWPKKNDSPRVSVDAKGDLVVIGDAKATTTTVLTVEKPKVPSHQYRLVGKIKYEDVAGDGYLEMWNHFPNNEEYFSKTLAPEGKLGKISGSSDWREVELPFYSKPDMLPTKLVINVVLPYVRIFEAAMERSLLTDEDRRNGVIIRFNVDAALRGDFLSRQQGLKIQREAGVINANDWRQHEGLNPISEEDGGEEFWRQGPSGQSATTDATPPNESTKPTTEGNDDGAA